MQQIKDKNFLILDDDPVILKMTENHFKNAGAAQIYVFEEAAEAQKTIKKETIHGFILDWELANQSAHGFFSRIRGSESHAMTPMIVICRKMEKSDLTLIDEFPCTSFLQKPFTAALITNKMANLILEQEQYEKVQKLVDGFMLLAEESSEKATEAYEKIKKRLPDSRAFQILAARTFRNKGHLDQALAITEEILEAEPKSLPGLTEQAKIFYALGKHDIAISSLEKAIQISPKNFDRILLAGKAHLQRQEMDEASSYFNDALQIDPDSKTAKRGVQTCENMAEYFQAHGNKGVPGNLASLLNIIGVNFVRKNDMVSAIEQYQAAFEFAQSDIDRARVAFNLGLGFLKSQDAVQAGEWFTRSIDIHPICKAKATQRLEKMGDMQSSVLDAPIQEDEILGGFIEPEKKEGEDKVNEPKKTEEEKEFDDFLDSFDIDDV